MLKQQKLKNTESTEMARLPIIFDADWGFFHGTPKVRRGALKGLTAGGQNRLFLFCPQCERPLRVKLAGVSQDFTEWSPNNHGQPPDPVAIFEVECSDCGLVDHFKMICKQHREFGAQPALPQAQSRRVASTAVPPQALVPVIGEEDVNANLESAPALKVETDTDYLVFHCPEQPWKLCNGFRLVAAVRGPESKSVTGFKFECRCASGCVGDFVIPVTPAEEK